MSEVCPRCVRTVERAIAKHNLRGNVELGKIEFNELPNDEILMQLKFELNKLGFETMSNANEKLVEQIKHEIIRMIFYDSKLHSGRLSKHLEKKVDSNYSHLSRIF